MTSEKICLIDIIKQPDKTDIHFPFVCLWVGDLFYNGV